MLSFIGLIIFSPIIFLIFIIGLIATGSPLFIQKRLGRNQKSFLLIKFRTMHVNTKSVATHLIDDSMITPFGQHLRRTKIDEIPQLINVLIGDMSLIGPRPCLLNQKKLIYEREKRGVFNVKPGVTGLSQVSGIDMKTPNLLAETDLKMVEEINLYYYFFYIVKTFLLVFKINQSK